MQPSRPEHDAKDDESGVETLLAECLALEGAQRRIALERLCERHPEHASELRARFEWLDDSGLADENGAPARIPDEFAGFRLLERLGGGGMGIVHLAEETALGRKVALKTVRPENLWFPGARERFFREVRTVAQLKHAGIVPVFAVGEHERVPWFTMEWVQGCTLGELLHDLKEPGPDGATRRVEALRGADAARVVRRRAGVEGAPHDLPPLFTGSWSDFALRVTAAVADALAHAHAAGVLHRDVKPSNVMIARDGRVLLLDFGLASAPDTDKITRSGSPLGSVPYMSPEQVRGEAVDERTDVYSLGVTLYELLSLHEAFGGRDAATTWRRILEGDAEPLRSLHRGLPADVDAVCRVAMDVERSRRYATVGAMRDDLRRLLERRPIEARPPGPMLRARRFVQRHPTLSATAALLLVVAAGVPTAFLLREQEARRRIELEAETARETITILEDLFLGASPRIGLGVNAPIGEVLATGVAQLEERLVGKPELRRRLIAVLARVYATLEEHEKALELIDEALELAATDSIAPDDETILLRVHRASSLWGLARFAESEEGYRQLLATREEAFAPEWRAQVMALYGILQAQLGRTEEGRRTIEAAVHLAETTPVNDVPRATVARRHAEFLLSRGEPAAALLETERARDLVRKRLGATHVEGADLDDLSAQCLLDLGRIDEAEKASRDVLERVEKAHGRDGLTVHQTLQTLATIASRKHDYDEAERLLRRRIEIIERHLYGDHPLIAWALNDLGVTLSLAGRFQTAVPLLERAVAIERARPDLPASQLAITMANLAEALVESGRASEAVRLVDEAITIVRAAPNVDPENRGQVLRIGAWVAHQTGALRDSETRVRESISLLEGVPSKVEQHGRALQQLALTLTRLGRAADAEIVALRAMEVVRSSPAVDRIWIANSHYHLGWARNCLGRLAEAEREYRASIAEYDLLAVEYPLMAFPLNQLGDLLADRREPEAVPLLERSLAIRRRTLPPSSEFLTLNRHSLAVMLVRVDRPEEALPLFEENVAVLRAVGEKGHEQLAAALYSLAQIRRERGEIDVAVELAREAMQIAHLVPPNMRRQPDLPRASKLLLGVLLLEVDEYSEAEELLKSVSAQGFAEAQTARSAADRTEAQGAARDAVLGLVKLYERRDQPERAAEMRRTLEKLLPAE